MLPTLVFAIAVGGDTFALFVEHVDRRQEALPAHQLRSSIVSGAIGGLLGSVLMAWLVGTCSCGFAHAGVSADVEHPRAGPDRAVAAQMGDLFASMVKRHCAIKDFGNLFPGHGMPTAMDSILFSAIIAGRQLPRGGHDLLPARLTRARQNKQSLYSLSLDKRPKFCYPSTNLH